MEKSRESISFLQCRLCSAFGHHNFDIFGENSRLGYANPNALADKIFQCVDIRVERDDETTKICGKCVRKLNKFARFRGMCAATNAKMGKSKRLRHSSGGRVHHSRQDSDATSTRGKFLALNPSSPSETAVPIISPIVEMDSECEEMMGAQIAASETQMSIFENESSTSATSATAQAKDTTLGSRVNRAEYENMNQAQVLTAMRTVCVKDEWLSLSDDHIRSDDETEQPACEQTFAGAQQQLVISNETDSSMDVPQRRGAVNDLLGPCLDVDKPTKDVGTVDSIAQTFAIYKASYSVETRKRVKHKVAKQGARACSLVKCRSRGRCNELFESWDAMMYHMATYHAKGIKRKYSCHLCKYTSTLRAHLQLHIDAVHIGLKRFKCPFPKCSKAFAQRGHLQQHTNTIHTKNVTFKCTKCPAKFYQKDPLTRHLANAHGQGHTYSCYLCKKSLGNKQTLHRHMDAVHMGLRRFKCPFLKCSKAFAHKCNLQKHTNAIHTKEIAFECTKCPAKFYHKQLLTRHMTNVHGQGMTLQHANASSAHVCETLHPHRSTS